MDEQSFYAGRLTALLLYLGQGIYTIIKLYTEPRVSNILVGVVCAFWIGSYILLLHLTEEKGVTKYAFCIFTGVSSMILAAVLGYVYRSLLLIIVVYMVQSMVVIMFRQKKSCIVISIATILTMFQFALLDKLNIYNMINWMEFWVSLVVVMISTWIMICQMTLAERQNKKNEDQEKSLDDMLHIVEVMCDEAREATKSKSEFLSNMSHEIRTPINSVLGMNEMILRESREKETLKYARNIASSGNMLLSLVNDILDFSKIESGKMELVPVNYHLSSVLNDLINIITSRVDEKGLDFHVEVDPEMPEFLYGDEMRVKQIVTNLLTNAVKYTDQGAVTLRVYADRNEDFGLYFQVQDTGRGIKEEDQKVLFQAFQRVDESANRNIEGTGLGLAIVSNYVKLMRGDIQVQSTYGEGSTFTVWLPQVITDDQPIGNFVEKIKRLGSEEDTYSQLFEAPEARILLVDDNKMNLSVASLLLKQTKIQIVTAGGGREAIKKMGQQQFDLVLLDHMMPGMDGIETLQHLKAEGLVEHTPVIALTANAVAGARETYLDAGFSDYLTKPIVGKDLERMMIRWLPEEKVKRSNAEDFVMSDVIHVAMAKPEPILPQQRDAEAEATQQVESVLESALIDEEVAMEYAGGDPDIRDFMVQAYLEEEKEKEQKLAQALEIEDFEQYRITVHAVKSTSLGVGAVQLSNAAKELEFAAKDGDYEKIRQGHQELEELMQAVAQELEPIIS